MHPVGSVRVTLPKGRMQVAPSACSDCCRPAFSRPGGVCVRIYSPSFIASPNNIKGWGVLRWLWISCSFAQSGLASGTCFRSQFLDVASPQCWPSEVRVYQCLGCWSAIIAHDSPSELSTEGYSTLAGTIIFSSCSDTAKSRRLWNLRLAHRT